MPTACGHYMFTDMLVALLRLGIEPLDFRIEPLDFRIKSPLYFLHEVGHYVQWANMFTPQTRSRSASDAAVHKIAKNAI